MQEQLSIIVLSFDSLRTTNKEGRKAYQENGNLQSFGPLVGTAEDITLMRVLQALYPVVVVDESHNAESNLSVDMLKNLNPAFILDLTATPRKNSNIISFVDALALFKIGFSWAGPVSLVVPYDLRAMRSRPSLRPPLSA